MGGVEVGLSLVLWIQGVILGCLSAFTSSWHAVVCFSLLPVKRQRAWSAHCTTTTELLNSKEPRNLGQRATPPTLPPPLFFCPLRNPLRRMRKLTQLISALEKKNKNKVSSISLFFFTHRAVFGFCMVRESGNLDCQLYGSVPRSEFCSAGLVWHCLEKFLC